MRIALFRPLGLAGVLRAVPALRALDAAFPEASITLIGLPRLRDIASRLHRYIDAFAAFPGFPGIPDVECDLDAVPDFFARMRAERFDLAVQMHGSGEIANPLMVLMGAAHHAGFHREGRYCPDAQRYLRWRDDEDEVARWLRLAAHLGAAPRGSFLEFPLQPQDWAEWRALRLEKYVCLHCGAQPQRFAELGDALAAEGWNVVLTGAAPVAAAMHEPAISLAGRTSLGGTAAVIAKARLVVSSDADTALIAAAMRTPATRLTADVRETLREARALLGRAA
jgi:ADP-heptose:LPS heptosyltransferase